LETEHVLLIYDPSHQGIAKQVSDLVPKVRNDLAVLFQWDLPYRPAVLLCSQHKDFLMMARNPQVVAFAVPKKGLIVMDYTRLRTDPFRLEMTLKHELCHLLLHADIDDTQLYRWFEEGICDWVSEGIGEIVARQRRSLLNRAALSEGFIPLAALERGFPAATDQFLLAYEQSKSFVSYLIRRFGSKTVFQILKRMREGEGLPVAIRNTTANSLSTLEFAWRESLKSKMSWFVYAGYYLYEVLFGVAAILGLVAFVRLIRRKRAYEDAEED
jgi:hypothetical protein